MDTIDDFFFATGSDELWGFGTFNEAGVGPAYSFGTNLWGHFVGVFGVAEAFGPSQRNQYSLRAGAMGDSQDFTGAVGTSLHRVGVYGQVEDRLTVPLGLLAGVLGVAGTQPGVIGFSRAGDGVQGASFGGTAVRALSFFGPGVNGISGTASGVTGICGTPGPTAPNFVNVAGVVGSSDAQPGVLGTSKSFAGVFGFSNNSIGVTGQTLNPNSFAGFFAGNVIVNGTLTANVKNAVVTFPDGSHRVLHCMESPEHWFEDFGTGKLRGGRATIKLDADFAKVIRSTGYHVFVTPADDCRGLCV